MKVKVTSVFRDKFTGQLYNPDEVIEIEHKARVENLASRGLAVPKCPCRYIYKSKYCNHYSYTAYSRLITPY